MRRNARLVELRLFAARFEGAAASGVTAALGAYHNEDGGFGYALEADTRCPASLPIYVETALSMMATAGTCDRAMVSRACDFLSRTAAELGTSAAVPAALPVIEAYPRAAHWTAWTYEPALNPTAGLVGLLYQLGAEHPWRDAAAKYCWEQLDAGAGLSDAHTLWEVLVFLAHVPDQDRAQYHARRLAAGLAEVPMLHLGPESPGYGVSPLQLAPSPGSRWRSLFSDEQIEGHLRALAGAQDDDGGWPLNWEPPAGAARAEWRGVVTLEALLTLTAYGRLQVA